MCIPTPLAVKNLRYEIVTRFGTSFPPYDTILYIDYSMQYAYALTRLCRVVSTIVSRLRLLYCPTPSCLVAGGVRVVPAPHFAAHVSLRRPPLQTGKASFGKPRLPTRTACW